MKIYGLVGYPLSHTFSPGYFNDKFQRLNMDAVYKAFPLPDIKLFPELLLAQTDLSGLNVTIPYKEKILPYLHALSDAASVIGAVNCIQFDGDTLIGHNTDAPGFWAAIKSLLKPHHRRALVLGTGGASKAVVYALAQAGIETTVVSRTLYENAITYNDMDEDLLSQHTIIINTTPLGMAPSVDTAPDIPYHLLSTDHLLYDVVYNPVETLFMKKGKAKGAAVSNGYDMLINQAEASWEIWNK